MLSLFRKLRDARRPSCAAIVVAAGNSVRMNVENKLLLDLGGAPVLARTLSALQLSRRVDEIIVAVRKEDLEPVSRLCRAYQITKCSKVVRGGDSRVESAYRAALEASPGMDLLAVHDGARPLVTPELVDRVIEAAARVGAAGLAVPVKDTVKRVDSREIVEETLARASLRAMQTPQVFDAALLKAALQKALESGDAERITDDCFAVELLGKEVLLVEGDEENLKITSPLDMALARTILEERKGRA